MPLRRLRPTQASDAAPTTVAPLSAAAASLPPLLSDARSAAAAGPDPAPYAARLSASLAPSVASLAGPAAALSAALSAYTANSSNSTALAALAAAARAVAPPAANASSVWSPASNAFDGTGALQRGADGCGARRDAGSAALRRPTQLGMAASDAHRGEAQRGLAAPREPLRWLRPPARCNRSWASAQRRCALALPAPVRTRPRPLASFTTPSPPSLLTPSLAAAPRSYVPRDTLRS
jgi:hypothetical protein